MSYLEQLDRALRDCGFDGRRRRRIVAEFTDHLQENPAADLGDPAQIARRFADELGTHRARTAALAAFAALVFAGVIVAIRGAAMLPLRSDGSEFDTTELLVALLAGQVALAAGGLAGLRALRLRREPTIPRREAVVLARRAGVGLAAGAATIIALPFRGTHGIDPGALRIGSGSTRLSRRSGRTTGRSPGRACSPSLPRSRSVTGRGGP